MCTSTWWTRNEGTFHPGGPRSTCPYSSLVSNVQDTGDTFVVNNGVSQCFEEYDQQGQLIRQYQYSCTANGYRVMKR